ncbi:MAG: CBS domain-containing protein [Rhodocyclaceae bacterium]|nr:CBS domain-containing protein [Rhodocyclaceae bacterium]
MSDRTVVRVREVMQDEFDMVDGMATIAEALKAMKHVEARGLIVNKRHDDDEFGMLLITDIARHVLGKDRAPERVNVYEVMAKPVITVDPEMDIRYCARLFTRFDLSRAPVVENGKVVGMVSMYDLVFKGLYTHL